MRDLTEFSIPQVLNSYRKKELSPVEVVTAHLKRARELQPKLNAFVHVDEESAIAKARAARCPTVEGIQMFAVCSKKESKNDAPGFQKVREQMFDQKFSAQAKRYLANLRRQAMIEYKQPVDETSGGKAGAKR